MTIFKKTSIVAIICVVALGTVFYIKNSLSNQAQSKLKEINTLDTIRNAQETVISISESYKVGAYDEIFSLMTKGAQKDFVYPKGINPYKYEKISTTASGKNYIVKFKFFFNKGVNNPYSESWKFTVGMVGRKMLIKEAKLLSKVRN